jgi:hypothetical protein
MSYYISPRFLDNFPYTLPKAISCELPGVKVPLILVFMVVRGGKCCGLVFERMGVEAIHMSVGE